ncbi:MAG: GNAT family N-acetyltransferase [Salaquimonas sp.]
MTGKKPKLLKAHITHLEMRARPTRLIAVPSRPRLALLQSQEMPIHYYRYLYEQIGKAHHWYERRKLNDEELKLIIHAEATDIEVLYANGNPAGYFELAPGVETGDIEIVYFGILPDYQGLGLGKWFLNSAIQRAWDLSPERVIVHTNTLDHPAALQLYQKMGFSPYAVSEEEVAVWE